MEFDKIKGIDYSILAEEVFNNIPYCVFWKDRNLVFRGCNKKFAQQFGFQEPKDISGKVDKDFPWPQDLREKYNKDDLYVINTGESLLNVEELQRQENGEDIIALVNKVPLYDSRKNITGVIGFYTDITKIKETERDLKDAKHKLDGMTLVSASLAHELRTPLSSLSLELDTISDTLSQALAPKAKPNSEEDYKELVNLLLPLQDQISNMKNVTDSAAKMINILLTNIKPIKQLAGEVGKFSAKSCVEEALHQYPLQPSDRQLVNVSIKEDFIINGNSEYLKHILFNLIKNSLYYIRSSEKGEILIATDIHQAQNVIYFKDTGAGIPKAFLPKIFDRFFTNTYHGAGIGLAFCKLAMKSFGGDIACESEEGKFTEFTLFFPKIERKNHEN